MKTLIWITHTFRKDSRLYNSLEGECSFVYYSPFYFAGDREKAILKNTNQQNLELFYGSINHFKKQLNRDGGDLTICKESDPIAHINMLIEAFGYTKIVIDEPQFAMWHSLNTSKLSIEPTYIDSDLIQTDCNYRTAKHRWMHHASREYNYYLPNNKLTFFNLTGFCGEEHAYPKGNLPNVQKVLDRAYDIASNYANTRDKHNGQTELSTLLQNGLIDSHNIFYTMIDIFKKQGADLTKNEGAHAAMLRQFTFRELTIIKSRQLGLTMENNPAQWLSKTITEKSYNNLVMKTNEESTLTFEHITNANTTSANINRILTESFVKGVMPNRARMYYAGWLFYNAKSGIEAISLLINTFDLLFTDGQCPNNYMSCCSSMNMSYGKVMLLNKDRVMSLLDYESNKLTIC